MGVFTGGWMEFGEWPYHTIQRCVIVPGSKIDKSFSLMFLTIGSGTVILGIPEKIDLKKLAGFLSGKGVTVTPGRSVPPSFRKPLNPLVGLAIPAAAMLCGLAGAAFYLVRISD
jgi:hypothetical protein